MKQHNPFKQVLLSPHGNPNSLFTLRQNRRIFDSRFTNFPMLNFSFFRKGIWMGIGIAFLVDLKNRFERAEH